MIQLFFGVGFAGCIVWLAFAIHPAFGLLLIFGALFWFATLWAGMKEVDRVSRESAERDKRQAARDAADTAAKKAADQTRFMPPGA